MLRNVQGKLPDIDDTADSRELPTIAVIIAAKNEEQYIRQCIQAVIDQDYPENRYQIVVVDNFSDDNTVAIAREFDRVTVLQSEGYVGAVRNTGARQTESDLVAFLDADCVPGPGWLTASLETLESKSEITVVSAMMGYEISQSTPWIEELWVRNYQKKFTENITVIDSLTSFCFLIPRSVGDANDWFNEEMSACEDAEFGYRLQSAGAVLVVNRAIEVPHLGNAKTLTAHFNRQLWQGSSNISSLYGHNPSLSEIASAIVPMAYLAVHILFFVLIIGQLHVYAVFFLALIFTLPAMLAVRKSPFSNLIEFLRFWVIWWSYLIARGLSVFYSFKRRSRKTPV